MEMIAKVRARGFIKGEYAIIECLQYVNKNGTKWQTKILKNRKEDLHIAAMLARYILARHVKHMNDEYSYNPEPDTIEAYWLAFNYGDDFDEIPEIEVEGKIDTFGSPFSDEDTSGVVF